MTSFKVLLGILFGLLVTAIAFLGIISYQYYELSVATASSIDHTHRVIDKTEEISASYKDLQLESNGVFVSGDTTLIGRYDSARNRISFRIAELRSLTSDDPAQQRRIDSLSMLVGDLMKFTDSVLEISFSETLPEKKLQSRFRQNALYRSEIGQVILGIKENEQRLLVIRQKAHAASNRAFRNTFLQLIGVITILIGATFFSVRYNFNKRVTAELDLKQAQGKLQNALASEIELNKMKSNFVTLASHEFRTPLTTILSSTFLLEKYATGGDKSKIDKHISRIRSSVNNITSILDDFLSITKIEERKVVPHVERVNLKESLEGACQHLGAVMKPGQSIVYSHTGEEFVETDPMLLGNIVTNLVSNAIKYSPENSRIFVTSAVDGKLRLEVKDNGIGIPLEDQKHLFKRFYRASNAGTVQGTGLGLNIMKHYVDMLHGEIRLQSEPGRGTEIQITFDPANYLSQN